MRLRGASVAALIGLVVGLAASVGPAEADKVGVAAAVNPDAFASLAGSPQTQLSIGKSIFFNERINTTNSGLVQVLLVDGSTFTVGPNSDLVIDKFVYDPKKQSGQIVATVSKGVMRFVGGKISKNEGGVTVNTPAGALAIRGAISLWDFKSPTNYTVLFVFGKYLKLGGNTLFQQGYGWFNNDGHFETKPFSSSDLATILASLTNGSANGLGKADNDNNGTKPGTGAQLVNDESNLKSNANTSQIQGQVEDTGTPPPCTGAACNPPPPPPQPVPVNVRVLASPGVYTAFPLIPGWTYTTGSGSGSGILGGGYYPGDAPLGLHADDFNWTFEVLDGRLSGTMITGLIDANCTDPSCATIEAHTVAPNPSVDFPWFQPNQTDPVGGACDNGLCTVTDAVVVQGEVTTNFAGIAVAKPGFFAYQVRPGAWVAGEAGPILVPADGDNDPLMLIGGDGYTFDTPSGKVHSFQLTQDISQLGAFGPFASQDSSPTTAGSGYVSPLVLLEKNTGAANDPSRAVWLQTSFFVGSDPDKPETFINVSLGEWDPVTGVTGMRRGGSSIDGAENQQTYSFTGDIASLGGPDGSQFLGSHTLETDNPNLVIGLDSTVTHNIGRDNPLNPGDSTIDNQSGATYHIGVGTGSAAGAQQTTATFTGYAAGIARTVGGEDDGAMLLSKSPEDVKITFDATRNTLSALLVTHVTDDHNGQDPGGECDPCNLNSGPQTTDYPTNQDKGGMTLVLGDPAAGNSEATSIAGRSAFIDDNHYAAIETPGASTIQSGEGNNNLVGPVTGYLVSGAQIDADNVLLYPLINNDGALVDEQGGLIPEGGNAVMTHQAFCTLCNFLKWGAWGAQASFYDNQATDQVVNANVNVGWWVAGDISSQSDVDTLGRLGATATYAGQAIGNVANNLNGTGWTTYVATGDVNMNWSFRNQSGDLSITHFDTSVAPGGLSFSGAMSAPGVPDGNHFTGSLSGQLPNDLGSLSGNAAGSFVNNGPGNPAAGVIGNWNVGNNQYNAGGIFAGAGTPVVPTP